MADELDITPYENGPIIVRGKIRLWDGEGREVPVHRRTVAICRCGKSRLHPLCDGTHKRIGFRADGSPGRE